MSAELGMRKAELKQRTFDFSVRVVRLVESLPKSGATQTIGRQLLRAGTSVGANYRAAKRARSRAEFIAKLGIVEEDCDETVSWIELLTALCLVRTASVADLHKEANEVIAIIIASIKTARANRN